MLPAHSVDPLIDVLDPGTVLTRVYARRWGPVGYNSTDAAGRFRPVRRRDGVVVPTAYLASDDETALAEAVLRGVTALEDDARPRRLYRLEVEGLDLCRLRVTKSIRVARLHGAGLQRLGLLRGHVVDCEEDEYDYTASWAQALWGCSARPHGIAWSSRQNDSGRAYVLWEPRVPAGALEEVSLPVRLDRDPGLDLVRAACVAAGLEFDG